MNISNNGMVFDIQRWSIHDGPGIRVNIFLKGCPLRCKWCCNPESQEPYSELAYFSDKCIACKNCERNCEYGAIKWDGDGFHIDRLICRTNCYRHNDKNSFSCTRGCYSQALKILGQEMSIDDVMKEALSDKPLFLQSGGGITVTGGDPLYQIDFLLEILKESKKSGIHTAIETSAMTAWNELSRILPFLDFIFVDMKIFDSDKHKEYVGVPNDLIKENLIRLNTYSIQKDLEIVIRTPVIPGINDSPEEIDLIATWIKNNLSSVKTYQLLAYHRLGRGKYGNIGKDYSLFNVEPPSKEYMMELEKLVIDKGLQIKYE